MKKIIGIISTLLFCAGVIAFFVQMRYTFLSDYLFGNELGFPTPTNWVITIWVEIIPCIFVFVALIFFGKKKIVNVILKFSVIALMCAGLFSEYLYCLHLQTTTEAIIQSIWNISTDCYFLPFIFFFLSAITAVFGKPIRA